MSENCKIAGFRILKVECDPQWDEENSTLTIKVEDKMAYRKPVDPLNKSGLLEIETNVTAEGSSEFRIRLLSQAMFEFEEMPSDFEGTLQNDCYPIAREKAYEAIKTITEAMGLAPLDLNALVE